jgi:hypothetical protein
MAFWSVMMRRLFTWRMNLYRLIVGAVVLAIVLPAWALGVRAMWLVAIGCIVVVSGAAIIGTRVLSIRKWLRR